MNITHQGVDALVGQIVLGGGVVLHQFSILGVVALADLVDLQHKQSSLTNSLLVCNTETQH